MLRHAKRQPASEIPPLRILSINEPECRFEAMLSNNYHTIYTNGKPTKNPYLKIINSFEIFEYEPLDLIICNNWQQLPDQLNLSAMLHVPIILMEHGLQQGQPNLKNVHKRINATNFIRQQLQNNGEVIPYAATNIERKEWDKRAIEVLVETTFSPQEMGTLKVITDTFPKAQIRGNLNPFFSEKERLECYNNSKIFLNLASNFCMSYQIVDAISAGCIIVTNGNPIVTEFIQHNKNGFVCGNIQEMKTNVDNILNHNVNLSDIQASYTNLVQNVFSKDKVTTAWNAVFKSVYNNIYLRD